MYSIWCFGRCSGSFLSIWCFGRCSGSFLRILRRLRLPPTEASAATPHAFGVLVIVDYFVLLLFGVVYYIIVIVLGRGDARLFIN